MKPKCGEKAVEGQVLLAISERMLRDRSCLRQVVAGWVGWPMKHGDIIGGWFKIKTSQWKGLVLLGTNGGESLG